MNLNKVLICLEHVVPRKKEAEEEPFFETFLYLKKYLDQNYN